MIPWRSSFHLLISFCCVDTAGVPFGPSLLGLHSPDLAAKKTCETPPRPKAKLRNPEPCTGSSQNTLLSSGWNGPSGNGESGLVEHHGTIQVTSPFMEYRHNYGIDWHTHKLKGAPMDAVWSQWEAFPDPVSYTSCPSHFTVKASVCRSSWCIQKK